MSRDIYIYLSCWYNYRFQDKITTAQEKDDSDEVSTSSEDTHTNSDSIPEAEYEAGQWVYRVFEDFMYGLIIQKLLTLVTLMNGTFYINKQKKKN